MRLATDLITRARSAVLPRVVVCDGDSITRGVGAHVTSNTTYPARASLLWPSPQWGTINIGIDGETFSQMLSNISADVYPYIDAAKNNGWRAVVSCAGGTNDIGVSGVSPQALLATATSYFAAMKARGTDFTVGWTLLARNGGNPINTSIATYNALLREAVSGKSIAIDYLVDAGNDATIGNPTNVTNSVVFVDGLHPTIYGTQVMANLLASGVLSYQSRCSVSSVSPGSGSHSGGGTAVINGTGLSAAKAVIIGGLMVSSFVVVSDGQITATLPVAQGTSWPWPIPGDVAVIGPNGCGQLRGAWTWT